MTDKLSDSHPVAGESQETRATNDLPVIVIPGRSSARDAE